MLDFAKKQERVRGRETQNTMVRVLSQIIVSNLPPRACSHAPALPLHSGREGGPVDKIPPGGQTSAIRSRWRLKRLI